MDALSLPFLTLALLQAAPVYDSLVHHAPRSCGSAALTFDLCPAKAPGFDAALVDYLRQNEIPATFFVSGQWARTHERQLRDILATPFFEVGTHGERHLHISRLEGDAKRAEFEGPIRLLKEKYGYEARLYRPPFGEYDPGSLALAKELGQTVVIWDVVSSDPDERKSAQDILARVRADLRGGSIPIFHANGKGKHTKEVIETIYPEFSAKGLRFTTLGNMLRTCPAGSAPAVAKAADASPAPISAPKSRQASAPLWPILGALGLGGALAALLFAGRNNEAGRAPAKATRAVKGKEPSRRSRSRTPPKTAKRRPAKPRRAISSTRSG